MKPLRIKSGLNVSKNVILSNVKSNVHRPWLDRKLGKGSLCIVGGGPSLVRQLDTIRSLDMDIMCLNGSHDYLLHNFIKPKYAVCLDARESNADFYKNPKDITYLIASQCSPKVFEALSKNKVLCWHAHTGKEVSEIIKQEAKSRGFESHVEIGGGCTVGLSSLYLAYALGYTDLHLFGFDSSFEDDHHAYKQTVNDGQDVIEVKAGDETFKTSPTMAKQAFQFQSRAVDLTRNGVELTVYGGGLLPKIHQEMHKPVDQEDLAAVEARKYSNMWSIGEYRNFSPGESHVETAHYYFKGGSLIDFGCGTGRPAQKFKDLGYDVLGIDHAGNCLDEDIDIDFLIANLWDLPKLEYDFGFCTDVMEHIPTEKVYDVLKNISNSVRKVYFQICTKEDHFGQVINDHLHLTVKPKDWWINKISRFWDVTLLSDDGVNFSVYGVKHERSATSCQ